MTDTTQTVPDQHSSVVGGSSAARVLNCPASVPIVASLPQDPGSVYANEGTTLHEMMTILLNDESKNPEDLLPFTFTHKDGWTYEITEDIWFDLGQPALDAFLDFMDWAEQETGGTFEYLVEQQVEFPGIPGAFGTGDVLWRCGDWGGCWDWKFGRTHVPVDGIAQLKFYLVAAIHTNPDFYRHVSAYWMSIMQPQVSSKDDTVEVLSEELDDFAAALVAAVKTSDEPDAPIRKGPWCKFQTCQVKCPLHVNPALKLAEKMAALEEDGGLADARPTEDFNPDIGSDVAALLDLAEVAEGWAKAVFSYAQGVAQDNELFREELREGGWILKAKRSAGRDWLFTEKQMVNKLRNKGLKKADMYEPPKLLSPAKVEKVFKRLDLGEMPETWAEAKPSSGATLARDDGREEWQSATDKVAALAERLGNLS